MKVSYKLITSYLKNKNVGKLGENVNPTLPGRGGGSKLPEFVQYFKNYIHTITLKFFRLLLLVY